MDSGTTIWELRFVDGRGASLYTTTDISADIGKPALVRSVTVAAVVFADRAISDARECFASDNVRPAWLNMAAVAYAIRYDHTADTPDPPEQGLADECS